MLQESKQRIGADVGGTFTDVILQRADGSALIGKRLSTPPLYDQAVVEAITRLAGQDDAAADISEVIHGTTVATNAVLERRGSRIALVTTRGFRDVLELRRLRTPTMYDLFWRKPPPLVPRELRFEIAERVLADGTIELPLTDAELSGLTERLRGANVEAVAVCLINSYLYPDHEERVGEILRKELSDISVSLSSEILREQGEYERSATTAVNTYVQPLMSLYLNRITDGLAAAKIQAPLMIMQSSGGIMTADDARIRPVFALESGPAAGVVATLAVARQLGWSNVISFDMGGTTAKASLIERSEVSRGREYEAGGSLSAGSRLLRGSGELLRIPTIDIAEVGAGGGSIAWLDAAGGFYVGPRSAGADPGPACYGRGGSQPTVTDANVVLGYMPVGRMADGEIAVDRDLAVRAVQTVAEPLGLQTIEAAEGIHILANATMMRALRAVSSERGRDPREFAIMAYGGAGPVHAVGLAESLDVRTVLVPPMAGFFSAVGLLYARPEFHEVRTCQLDARTVDPGSLKTLVDDMQSRLRAKTERSVDWLHTADLRYKGQSWEVEVALPQAELSRASLDRLVEDFEDEHETLYGVRGEPDSPVEIRAIRVAALGDPPAQRLQPPGDADGSDRKPAREAYFRGVQHEVPTYRRSAVGVDPMPGPLFIDEYDTTVVVPPGWSVRREEVFQTLILEIGDSIE